MAARHYHALLALNFAVAAHCMVAQMALSVTLSFVAGHSATVFALFVGLYLAAMGGGVLVVERFEAKSSQWTARLLGLAAVAGAGACIGIPAVMLTHELLAPQATALVWGLGGALCLGLGGVAGAFLPIVSKIAETERWPAVRPFIGALTSDYAGAFVGTMVFALVLYPHLGLVRAVVLSQALIIIVVNLAAVGLGVARARPGRTLAVLGILDLWLVVSLTFQGDVVAFLDRSSM